MRRLPSNTTPLLLIAALLVARAPRAEAQAPEPRAVDAARCTFDATAVLGAPSTSAAFSRDGSLLALYAPAGLALVRSEDCAIVASTTHPIEVDSVFASYPVQLVVTDRERVAVVTAHDGVWLWERTEPTVRRILEDRTTAIATHAGGEDIILEVDADSNATLVRLNVATGRITRRRTLPPVSCGVSRTSAGTRATGRCSRSPTKGGCSRCARARSAVPSNVAVTRAASSGVCPF